MRLDLKPIGRMAVRLRVDDEAEALIEMRAPHRNRGHPRVDFEHDGLVARAPLRKERREGKRSHAPASHRIVDGEMLDVVDRRQMPTRHEADIAPCAVLFDMQKVEIGVRERRVELRGRAAFKDGEGGRHQMRGEREAHSGRMGNQSNLHGELLVKRAQKKTARSSQGGGMKTNRAETLPEVSRQLSPQKGTHRTAVRKSVNGAVRGEKPQVVGSPPLFTLKRLHLFAFACT